MTLRRETILTTLAILVFAAAIPFAIVETIETGRVYLFSRSPSVSVRNERRWTAGTIPP